MYVSRFSRPYFYIQNLSFALSDYYIDSKGLFIIRGQHCCTPFEAIFVCNMQVLNLQSIKRLSKNYICNNPDIIDTSGRPDTCKMCTRHMRIEATGAEAISKLISHQLSCTAYQCVFVHSYSESRSD